MKTVEIRLRNHVKCGIVSGATPVSTYLRKSFFRRCLLAALLLSQFGVISAQQAADGFDALAASAVAAQGQHDFPRAIQLYSDALLHKPGWTAGWWSLGLLEYAGKQWSDAAQAFTRYIALMPEASASIAQATALRGLCALATGDFAGSLADLQHSIALGATNDPGSATLIRLREAQVLNRLGRFDEALSVYGALASTTSPSQRDAEWNIGAGLAGLREPQLPGEIEVSRQERFALAGEATLRFMGGDRVGAQQMFSDFFMRFSQSANAHSLYASLLSPTDPDAAIDEYKQELAIAPANGTVAAMLARVLLYQSQPAEALPFAQRAATEDPDSAVAQLVLGRSLTETGDLSAGINHLQKALELQPGYLETHIALAGAYSSAGRSQDARRERLQSLEMAESYRARQ